MNDRNILQAMLIGKISGICRGFSLPDDADQAMRHICDALIEYEGERAKSFDAENGPFASTFAVYAKEARDTAAELTEVRARWEVSNTPRLFQSVEYLLGHLIDVTTGQQREFVYAAGRFVSKARATIQSSTGEPASAEQAAGQIQ